MTSCLAQAQLELEERRAEQDRIHLQLEEHVRPRPPIAHILPVSLKRGFDVRYQGRQG